MLLILLTLCVCVCVCVLLGITFRSLDDNSAVVINTQLSLMILFPIYKNKINKCTHNIILIFFYNPHREFNAASYRIHKITKLKSHSILFINASLVVIVLVK